MSQDYQRMIITFEFNCTNTGPPSMEIQQLQRQRPLLHCRCPTSTGETAACSLYVSLQQQTTVTSVCQGTEN